MDIDYLLIAPYKVKGVINTTIEECISYLTPLKIVGVDIETTRKFKGKYGKIEGLDPYVSNIVMIQVGDENKQFIIDARVINKKEILKLFKTLSTKVLVGHNIKFEYKHFLVNYGIRLNKVYDTMIAEQILYNGLNKRNALGELNKRYFGITVDKSTRLEFLSVGKKNFTERQIKYGAEDILYPALIRKEQLIKLTDEKLMNCFNLEMQFLLCLGDIETKGLYFDKKVWAEAYEKAIIVFNEYKEILDSYIIDKHSAFINRQLSLFEEGVTCGIQWSSSKQVVEFFDSLGICPEAESKATKQIRKTVESKELATVLTRENLIEEYRWLIKTYLKFMKATQAVTTFGIGFFKYINPITNRLHSSYTQIMKTGRISSRAPNLQNIPSNTDYRKAFSSPKNYKIVNADYAGQEQIILVNKSLDKDLLGFYYQGHSDMHSFVASKIYPELAEMSLVDIKKEHKDKRQIAKAAGFAINYGGTGFTIAKNLGIPESQGNFVFNAYFEAFPGLKNYFEICKKLAVLKGSITIDKYTNRKYYFPHLQSMKHARRTQDTLAYNKLKGKLERASLNFPIQGCAGSMTKLAVVYIRAYLIKNNAFDRFQITNLVHDEINCEAKEEYAEECAKVMEIAMKKAADVWCKTIKMNAEAVIGNYWTH